MNETFMDVNTNYSEDRITTEIKAISDKSYVGPKEEDDIGAK